MVAMTTSSPPRRVHLTQLHLAVLALISLSALYWVAARFGASSNSNTTCLASHGAYKGSVYAKPAETIHNQCLVESPWMRLARHSVRLRDGTEIDDWLWIDYHDRINVLVEAPPDNPSDKKDITQPAGEASFLILSQTKYALDTASLAVVGGIIEPHEAPEAAARREVKEELAVQCEEWTPLGRFRTDVNRGMGWVHPFLARGCHYTTAQSNVDEATADEVGGRDTEKQKVQTMGLSEVRKAVTEGKFVEVQWSNTVALAVLLVDG